MAFKMTKDLETGNTQIDHEHRELFVKLNAFLEACSQGKGKAEIVKTVEFLRNYTHSHFAHEEVLQKEKHYPNYPSHKKFHDDFIRTLDQLAYDIENNGICISTVGRINMEVGSILVNHIKMEDVRMAKFIREH